MSTPTSFELPFDELSNPRQVWVGTPGSHEEGVGRLALLTPDVVTAAAKEIQNGDRVTLGWEMTKLELANMNRYPCQHHIIPLFNGVAFDDVYVMNPRRCSTYAGCKYSTRQGLYHNLTLILTKIFLPMKSRAASGMDFGIFPKLYPTSMESPRSESSMVAPRRPRSSTAQAPVSACNIGLTKASQACSSHGFLMGS